MAVTTDKYSAQLSADATRLATDLGTAGKEIDKFKKDTDKKLSAEPATPHGFIKSMKKDFKTMAKDIAFVGMAADHLTSAFGGTEGAIGKIVSIGKEISLGWAVGGPIGAGIAGAVVLFHELDKTIDNIASGDASKKFADFMSETVKGGGMLGMSGAGPGDGQKADKTFFFGMNQANLGMNAMVAEAKMQKQNALIGASEKDVFLDQINQQLAGLGQRNELLKSFGKLFDEREKRQVETAGDKFGENLKEQIELMGKTGMEADLYKLKLKGLSEEGLASATFWLKAYKAAQTGEEAKKFQTDLTRQNELFGMSAERAKLLELAAKGANDEEMKGIALQIARNEALNAKPIGPNMALRVGSAAGIAAINQSRRESAFDDATKNTANLQTEANTILKDIRDRLDNIKNQDGTVDIFKL